MNKAFSSNLLNLIVKHTHVVVKPSFNLNKIWSKGCIHIFLFLSSHGT